MSLPNVRIGFKGKLVEGDEIRAAVVDCGSHSFRNIFPSFQFAPVKLIATCDFNADQAEAFLKAKGLAWR